MEKQQPKVDRKVIPRWRSLIDTPAAELVPSSTIERRGSTIEMPADVLDAWRRDQTIESASELLAIAPMFGPRPDITPAATFLRQHLELVSPGVEGLVEWYEARIAVASGDGARKPIAPEDARKGIRELKGDIKRTPSNPIAMVERARLHSILGQSEPARQAMWRALALVPHNRFVLRSAVRMLVSQGHFDEGLAVLRNAPPADPWLAAARISLSDLMQQTPSNVTRAIQLLDDRPPHQISELAAALGTLELNESFSSRRAKRFFKLSSQAPNDNAVAQLRWANETRGIPFQPALLSTERSYEARTGQAVRQKDWALAVRNTLLWLADEPFAKLPATDGCFWAAELRRDFESAELLATVGLTAHPNDITLLNNRAYARANRGNIIGARADLSAAKARTHSPGDKVFLTATEGCIHYRNGEYSLGAELYERSIRQALRENNHDSAQRAVLHWLHEEQRIGRVWEPELLLKIRLYFTDKTAVSESVRDIYQAHFANMPVVKGLPTPPQVQSGLDVVSNATLKP
jgi:tetratricopeptide (TPR) repeat protein